MVCSTFSPLVFYLFIFFNIKLSLLGLTWWGGGGGVLCLLSSLCNNMVMSCPAVPIHSLLPPLPFPHLSHHNLLLLCLNLSIFFFFLIFPSYISPPSTLWQHHRSFRRSAVCRIPTQSEDSHVEPGSHQKGGQAHDIRIPPAAARLWRHQSGVLPQTK